MRSCLECKLFHFWRGYYAFSEYTPGEDPDMACDATPTHWNIDVFKSSEEQVREALLTAETCKDFTQVGAKGDR